MLFKRSQSNVNRWYYLLPRLDPLLKKDKLVLDEFSKVFPPASCASLFHVDEEGEYLKVFVGSNLSSVAYREYFEPIPIPVPLSSFPHDSSEILNALSMQKGYSRVLSGLKTFAKFGGAGAKLIKKTGDDIVDEKLKELVKELPEPSPYYVCEAKYGRMQFLSTDFRVEAFHRVVSSLPPGSAVMVLTKLEHKVLETLSSVMREYEERALKARARLMGKAVHGSTYPAWMVSLKSRLSEPEPFLLVRFLVIARDKDVLREATELVKAHVPIDVKWAKWKEKKPLYAIELPKWTPAHTLREAFTPIRVGVGSPAPSPVACRRDVLLEWLKPPTPHQCRMDFVRGSPVPKAPQVDESEPVVVKRAIATDREVFVGYSTSHEPVTIAKEHLLTHAYVIGATGSGKSTALRYLVHLYRRAFPEAAIVVIDPHGTLARELYEEVEGNAVLFDPEVVPFGLNPLDLPEDGDYRKAVDAGVHYVEELFHNVLRLPEEAQYVRNIIRTVMATIYLSGVKRPPLTLMYRVLISLLVEKKRPVKTPYNEHLFYTYETLYTIPDYSIQSTVARINQFTDNTTLSSITWATTFHVEDVLRPGVTTLFSLPSAKLSPQATRLLASAILFKVWIASTRRKNRNPVFLIVDEFQYLGQLQIMETILAEARKQNVFLVLAHQTVDQVDPLIWRSVVTNAGLKIIMRSEGPDAKGVASIDPAYSDRILEIVPSLSTGQAMLFLRTAREPVPPVVLRFPDPSKIFEKKRKVVPCDAYELKLDWRKKREVEDKLYWRVFFPLSDLVVETDWEKYVVLGIVWANAPLNEKEVESLAKEWGISGTKVRDTLNTATASGLLRTTTSKKKKVYEPTSATEDFLFADLLKASPSDVGAELITRLVYFVFNAEEAPDLAKKLRLDARTKLCPFAVKQVPGKKRPDMYLVPIVDGVPDFGERIAVEVETTDKNEEQKVENLRKLSGKEQFVVFVTPVEHANKLFEVLKKSDVERGWMVLGIRNASVEDLLKGLDQLEERDESEGEEEKAVSDVSCEENPWEGLEMVTEEPEDTEIVAEESEDSAIPPDVLSPNDSSTGNRTFSRSLEEYPPVGRYVRMGIPVPRHVKEYLKSKKRVRERPKPEVEERVREEEPVEDVEILDDLSVVYREKRYEPLEFERDHWIDTVEKLPKEENVEIFAEEEPGMLKLVFYKNGRFWRTIRFEEA